MSRKPDDIRIITTWTNGRKATVHLVQNSRGERVILKVYRSGFPVSMFREYLATRYVGSRLSIVPKVVNFRPLRKEIVLTYISGQRVLEWVLGRFGEEGVVLSEFQSFHGLETNVQIARAFERFRQSASEEARRLKQAIRESYASLHRIGIQHGGPDPRNVVYDEARAFIIDFDHARPGLAPAKVDYPTLTRWYGISP